MGAPNDLYDLCVEYLEACEAAVATSVGGAVNRVFVAPGLPPFDCCPQLTVHAGGPMEGETYPLQPMLAPTHRAATQGLVNLVQMTATIIRCYPSDEDPTLNRQVPAATIEQVAQETLGDIWAIWNHVRTLYRHRQVFNRPDGQQREFQFDPAVALIPQGGCAGWQIGVRVQLDGYAAVV